MIEAETSMEVAEPEAQAPSPPPERHLEAPSPMQLGSGTGEVDLDSNDLNPLNDSDLDEEMENELLGVQDVTIPGGHSDDSMTLGVCLGEEDML